MLNVPGIPAAFLVDHKGRGIGTLVGPIEWDGPEIVREIKSCLPKENEEKN